MGSAQGVCCADGPGDVVAGDAENILVQQLPAVKNLEQPQKEAPTKEEELMLGRLIRIPEPEKGQGPETGQAAATEASTKEASIGPNISEDSPLKRLAGFWLRKKDMKRLGIIDDDRIIWEDNFKEEWSQLNWVGGSKHSKLDMILAGKKYHGEVLLISGTAIITWEDGDSWIREDESASEFASWDS